ncbi:MAG: zf-HC2 domain-containing protein [Deltaproteobacteria bacterium]|nr:zf-HC2 domain-containing protein [Deltaproteobacteria bacterium]
MKRETCKKIRELTAEYHQNLLEADPASRVEAHLSQCPSCRKAYEETREVLTLLKKDHLPDPGTLFWNDLSSRIMAQVPLDRSQEKEPPWYKKLWVNPFGWPGYAWATALLLILLTPVVIYNINVLGPKSPSDQEIRGLEMMWGSESIPLTAVVETLSDKESVNLAKRVVARMGKDLPSPTRLLMDDELHWDVFQSLEGLTTQELEALIKKMGPGGSAGYRKEEENVC